MVEWQGADQASGALHTVDVLQSCLLRDLDKEQGLSPEVVAELHRTTDLPLRGKSISHFRASNSHGPSSDSLRQGQNASLATHV